MVDARRALPVLLAAVVVVLAGCGGSGGGGGPQKRVSVDWDVSHSHTPADVGWTQSGSDVDSREIRPTGPVRIHLPNGATFDAEHGIRRVGLDREGDEVTSITVFSEPVSVDAGYRLAVAWAQRFGLPREPLDRWHAKAGSQKPPDISAGRSLDNQRFLGPDGPVPSVELHTSFDTDRPVVASVQFFWPGRRAPAGTTTGT